MRLQQTDNVILCSPGPPSQFADPYLILEYLDFAHFLKWHKKEIAFLPQLLPEGMIFHFSLRGQGNDTWFFLLCEVTLSFAFMMTIWHCADLDGQISE